MAYVLLALSSLACVANLEAQPDALFGDDQLFEDGFEDVEPRLHFAFEDDATTSGVLTGYAFDLVNAAFNSGKVGLGLRFGQGGYASVAGMRDVLGIYPQVTVAFWLFVPLPPNEAFWDTINRVVAPYGGVQLGWNATNINVCVATTTNSFLGGGCGGFPAPSTGAWHHWIIRYAGTGTGAGQGGDTEIYVDDVLKQVRVNDASNNPVFNAFGMSDTMMISGSGATIDELKVFDHVFSPADQCTHIIGGTWNGSACALP